MHYHEPNLPSVFTYRGNEWMIHRHHGHFFARLVKYDSDTGPFTTYAEADDFIRLRGQ